MAEDISDKALQAGVEGGVRLALVGLPERVRLCEAGLEGDSRVPLGNLGLAAAAVAGVDSYRLSQELNGTRSEGSLLGLRRMTYLLDHRRERPVRRQV